jgi:hypothetical protein
MAILRAGQRQGASFIDVIVSIGIVVILLGGIYLVYFSIINVAGNLEIRTAATAVLHRQLEVIRNLPYEQVGTVSGIPSGVIAQSTTTSYAGYTFSINATVRNIDDPFDGTLNGSPNDTAPADYKVVELQVSCVTCPKFTPISITTTVAPKNLESTSETGSLFVRVFDGSGSAIQGADVRVVNASVTPAIDLTDVTNITGELQLVGVPTSTQSYQVTVSKSGYTAERTYPIGGGSNPNPLKPHATILSQLVTNISFSIDRVSALEVRTRNPLCSGIASQAFSLTGSKLIGASPDVLKFSTSSQTGSTGTKVFADMEWDTYAASLTGSSYYLAGTIPLPPLTIIPNTTATLTFVLQPAASSAILLTVQDAVNGSGIANATATLTYPSGVTSTRVTGRAYTTESSWTGGQYSSKSSEVEVAAPVGSMRLTTSTAGKYSLSSADASQSGSSSLAFYAGDADPGTVWDSDGAAPQWVELDLGSAVDVGAIRLLVSQESSGNTTHEVYAGASADPALLVHTFSGVASDGDWLAHTFAPALTSVRYIRVRTTASPSVVRWKEIEAYQPVAPISGWLISNTIDAGGASTTWHTVDGSPASQPAGTTVQFQIATNNDNATWNFVGPDGTGGTYFSAANSTIPASLSNKRYLRYKAYLASDDQTVTPRIDDVAIGYAGPCTPPYQIFYGGLGSGSYAIDVQALGYTAAATSVTVSGSSWQEVAVPLSTP